MNRYREAFPRRTTFLPVVHVGTDADQTLRNVRIAHEQGADGVFLINHSISYMELLDAFWMVRKEFPSVWIGLNFLDLPLLEALDFLPESHTGLWTDNADVTDTNVGEDAVRFREARAKSSWEGVYFGGVAFKGQREVQYPGLAARNAMEFVDVVTTSGERTGVAPGHAKIWTMKRAVGDFPLANASGITPKNMGLYVPHVDCFLISTGICVHGTDNFDPKKVRAISDIAHQDAVAA